MKKRIFTIISLVWLLNSCSESTIRPTNQNIGNVANCPQPVAEEAVLKPLQPREDFYSRFNYQPQNIIADADTVRFQTINYDFVFCRGNKTWTIQPTTFDKEALSEENQQEFINKLSNPPYEIIELNGKTYQYRVNLQPNPFPNFEQQAEQVILELITPDNPQPQRHILYTLEDVKQSQTGFNLGVAKVTAALQHDNCFFWAISSEQGEGSGGIATIVNYNPETEAITIIQPEEIKSQQITDLVIAGEADNPTFWIGTKIAGEGNPFLPGMGLVAYRPDANNLQSGSLQSYRVENSSMVGAIPSQLLIENDQLWVGTGNGICQIEWQNINNQDSWNCWRFALMSEIPSEGIPLYNSSLAESALTTLKSEETVEVLWFSPVNFEERTGRYEVRYDDGFTVNLDEIGAESWDNTYRGDYQPPVWLPPVYWVGVNWHWDGDSFVRGWDEVGLNYSGGGPQGISKSGFISDRNGFDHNTIRGDLEILELTENTTEVKYYSGWVEDELLSPYLTVVPQQQQTNLQPNPLLVRYKQLK
ncbi:hypothetical protein [Oscillatoria salina]|uniref:hypothetical protein n=1 Tax=Oscillatoria salina TaxID=331517 RepID=UPI0013BB74DA|nr:hypothetical protein [Oscillatoria salina]MBZ8178917.1 hypothetical protein [Oscillatoria salina IIICB1]NET86657.1 hypothetical protein [Kamptonema sp. SIO1D9]